MPRILRKQRYNLTVAGLTLAVAVAAVLGWDRVALIGISGLLAVALLTLARVRASLRESRTRELDLIKRERDLLEEVHQFRLAIDAAGGRILAAIKAARREGIERGREAHQISWDQSTEMEALTQLFQRIKPRAPMPSSARWALNPTGLLQLVWLIEQHRPGIIVELGSGTSTVWMGYALEQAGGGRLVSLEHLPEFADRTRKLVDIHGLGKLIEVRNAPLRPLQLGEATKLWYASEALGDLPEIDLLFVDGPPGPTAPQARYPALPVLSDRLADGATVVLDDASRADEATIVERWCAEIPRLDRSLTMLGDQVILTYRR
jgi:predicted O-methyltransferase YrrM